MTEFEYKTYMEWAYAIMERAIAGDTLELKDCINLSNPSESKLGVICSNGLENVWLLLSVTASREDWPEELKSAFSSSEGKQNWLKALIDFAACGGAN